MSENKDKGKPGVPGVSLDEALALFLSLTYPNGFPEGVDREELLRVLRAKIAADRPEWAAAGAPPQPPASETASSGSYSQIKAEIAQQAQQPDIPTDPGERYFYERHEEARRNREQREAQEREDRIKDELRRRLIAENQDSDDAALERALRIRQSLETRLRQALQLQADASESLTPSTMPGQTTRFVMEQAAPVISPSGPEEIPTGLTMSPPQIAPPQAMPAPPDSRQEFIEKLKHQEPDERIESLRQFYQARRAQLKPRAEVLNPRRPARSKRDQMLAIVESKTAEALALESQITSDRARPLELSEAARPRSRGLRLKEGKANDHRLTR